MNQAGCLCGRARLLALPLLAAVIAAAMPGARAAEKKKTGEPPAAGWSDAVEQPEREKLDLTMYQRIREEGLVHSHIMEYASALTDGIGPRLTGSPNMARANAWTRDQLGAMGCANAHLEDWGEFGMGWQQQNTWVRMTSPDTAVLLAQALPWSPATAGPVRAEAVSVEISSEADIEKYRGRLAGKIVLLGPMRPVPPLEKPLFTRSSKEDLEQIASFPVSDKADPAENRLKEYMARMELMKKVIPWLAAEKPAAIVRPSRDGEDGGGTGIVFDDNGSALGPRPYTREGMQPAPVVVMGIESYGRIYRLLARHVPVELELNVEAQFSGDHEHGFDTVAEIPGTDPALREQVVMVGGHLDSWAAGTGATDNGAGSVVALEVMRILRALDVHPRRTIRIALWSGEEQGLLGSQGYAKIHFGSAPDSTDPEELKKPAFLRAKAGPLELRPEQKLVSAYFNVDNGGGRIRGVYLQQNAAIAPIFRQWIEPLADLGVTTLTLRDTGGTDHLSFDRVGIPGFQFIQDDLDYETRTHHSNMDTYERLEPADLRQAATVEAIFVYNAAMRDQMLPRKPLPHPELEKSRRAPLPNVMPGAVEDR